LFLLNGNVSHTRAKILPGKLTLNQLAQNLAARYAQVRAMVVAWQRHLAEILRLPPR
jgi:hypothetical protein